MNRFKTIIGHEKQKRILNNQLDSGKLSHAYLFTGVEGIGKRTLAEDFAQEILKKGINDIEIENHLVDLVKVGYNQDSITVKDIRNVIEQTTTRPTQGEYRVFIIDNADHINNVAQNALLKTIEEPNPGNIFILVTDKPTKLIDTVISRCQEMLFHDLTETEKREFLKLNNINEIPMDLSESPGIILRNIKDPEYNKKLNDFYDDFLFIINGNMIELFDFAERASESKDLSLDILNYTIRRLNETLISSDQTDPNILRILNLLFELLDILSYNVNLRLQWESSLIKIITEKN